MSPDLERLVQLQHLDTRIADAKREIAAHPERIRAAEARLDEARQVVDGAKQKLKESQEARRALEKDAAMYQGRLSKFNDQLSAVKTNREYQAMQKEVEVAKAELRSVEDKELDRMDEGEKFGAAVKAAEVALSARQKEIEAETRELGEALARMEKTLQESTTARDTLVRQLDARLVALFEQLAKVRKGVAVCTARDGLCSLCRIRLRPHVYQQVRANDSIIQCDSCQRILYYIPPPPPVEHPVTHAPS